MTSQENRHKANQRRDRRHRQRLVVAALAELEPRPSRITVVAASALLAALPPPGKAIVKGRPGVGEDR